MGCTQASTSNTKRGLEGSGRGGPMVRAARSIHGMASSWRQAPLVHEGFETTCDCMWWNEVECGISAWLEGGWQWRHHQWAVPGLSQKMSHRNRIVGINKYLLIIHTVNFIMNCIYLCYIAAFYMWFFTLKRPSRIAPPSGKPITQGTFFVSHSIIQKAPLKIVHLDALNNCLFIVKVTKLVISAAGCEVLFIYFRNSFFLKRKLET